MAQRLLAIFLIYLASWCYVIAAYYHLKLQDWSFLKAAAIAIPAVLLEYSLSLPGNKLASFTMNPLQIVLLTIGFYVLNIILLNIFVLKGDFNPLRDTIAALLIVAAIFLSTNTRL